MLMLFSGVFELCAVFAAACVLQQRCRPAIIESSQHKAPLPGEVKKPGAVRGGGGAA
jgi:hypothetical protein